MLNELYQELILDHNKSPRNRREMPEATHHADGHNPLCGDQVTVYLHLDGDRVTDVSFTGQGCAISTASASLMTEAVMGKTLAEAERIFGEFHRMVTEDGPHEPFEEELEKLEAFAGVKNFSMRVKCATLAWHTLHAAMNGGGTAKTE